MCLSWQNRGRQRKSGGRTVCAPAQVRGKTANHRLAKLKAPGAKWEQRTDQNDAEHERQRREALVSAKALPRRSNFRKSPLGGPRIRGTGGKRTVGLRRNACGAVVPPGASPGDSLVPFSSLRKEPAPQGGISLGAPCRRSWAGQARPYTGRGLLRGDRRAHNMRPYGVAEDIPQGRLPAARKAFPPQGEGGTADAVTDEGFSFHRAGPIQWDGRVWDPPLRYAAGPGIAGGDKPCPYGGDGKGCAMQGPMFPFGWARWHGGRAMCARRAGV